MRSFNHPLHAQTLQPENSCYENQQLWQAQFVFQNSYSLGIYYRKEREFQHAAVINSDLYRRDWPGTAYYSPDAVQGTDVLF